jgi:hypothetical protein
MHADLWKAYGMHMKSQVRVLLGLLTEPNWVKYDQLLFFSSIVYSSGRIGFDNDRIGWEFEV